MCDGMPVNSGVIWGTSSSPGGSQPRGIGSVYVLLSSTVKLLIVAISLVLRRGT